MVLAPGAQRAFRLLSRTPQIPFKFLLRTVIKTFNSIKVTVKFIYICCIQVFTYGLISIVPKIRKQLSGPFRDTIHFVSENGPTSVIIAQINFVGRCQVCTSRQNCTKGLNCTRVQNCTKTLFPEQTVLHGDIFAQIEFFMFLNSLIILILFILLVFFYYHCYP